MIMPGETYEQSVAREAAHKAKFAAQNAASSAAWDAKLAGRSAVPHDPAMFNAPLDVEIVRKNGVIINDL